MRVVRRPAGRTFKQNETIPGGPMRAERITKLVLPLAVLPALGVAGPAGAQQRPPKQTQNPADAGAALPPAG